MSNTEGQSVHALAKFICQSKILKPFISENDKTPSWDGEIFFYHTNTKKENLIIPIPVQVKSRKVKKISSKITSYSLKMKDIKNYYKRKGTIVFFVEICGDSEKFFIKNFLPYELKTVISDMELSPKKSKSFVFHEISNTATKDLENICKYFYIHQKLQYSTIEHSLTIENSAELSIPLINLDEIQDEYFFDKDYLLYGSETVGGVKSFITEIKIASVTKKIPQSIIIDGKEYYSKYTEIIEKGDKFFEFGNTIKISIKTGKTQFKIDGNLYEEIIDMNFLCDFFLKREVSFTQGILTIQNIPEDDEVVQRVHSNREHFLEMEKLLLIFHISPHLLLVNNLEYEDFKNLDLLIRLFVNKEKFTNIPLEIGFNALKIGNIRLGVFVYKGKEDKYIQVLDIFSEELSNLDLYVKSNTDGSMVKVCPYIVLQHEFILNINNLDIDFILLKIKSFPFSEEYASGVTTFGLELIHCWDKTKDNIYLEKAKELYEWLLDKDIPNDRDKINEYQIIRRLRSLTKDEQIVLRTMRREHTDNQMLCGINILLENKADAESFFNELAEEEKNIFSKFPIYSLAKELGMFVDIN